MRPILRRHPPLLIGAVLTSALLAAIGGLALPTGLAADDSPHPLLRLALAVAVIGAAQLARLWLRLTSAVVSLTWGEAAFIIGLYLLPVGWLPAATLIGTGLAWAMLAAFIDRRDVVEVGYTAASLTVAVALGAVVVAMLDTPFSATLTPTLTVALVAGASTYLFVTAGLAALALSLRQRLPVMPLVLRAVQGKLLMFVGNVVVGLAAITMIEHDPRWLLLLLPVLWLLQQTYLHQLRASQERRAWQQLAQVTSTLNQLDERSVATAGVTGAVAFFGAEHVNLVVTHPDGRSRCYSNDGRGQVIDRKVNPRCEPAPAMGELIRTLSVGEVTVGELRVRLPRPILPGPREEDALSAYADALATALHGAATHRELSLLTVRSAYDATHDPLTNLVNRAALLNRGDMALRQLAHDQPVALMVFDLVRVKEVNNTLGYAGGDELLKIAAARLSVLTPAGDLLGRLGGDEFALLITALPVLSDSAGLAERSSSMSQALRRARKVVELLAVPTEIASVTMSIEASVGVVVATAGTADMTELLRRADFALEQAKEAGGGIASYDSAKDAASTDQLALLAELREALATNDQLVLALQPAVDLEMGAPTGVEALIRWRHPRRGRLNPADFVRAVEGSELLGSFTRYVIDKALSVAAEWARYGIQVPISVNLSARSLLDPRLPIEVAELLRHHQVPAQRLVLEITESVVMSELDVIDEVFAALRALGVQLAVDDFGTGFSSLAFLARLPVDELKVDRSFVMRMADSKEAAAIVRATIDLGRGLGLRVVAEGVETADQRAVLAELGCSAAQGYHFFKPMPADKIVTVLRSLLDSAEANVFPLRADDVS